MANSRRQLLTITLMAVSVLICTATNNAEAKEQESLSAIEAQGASRRVDTEVGFINASDGDQFTWQLQYTSVLRKKHQLTALLPFVDPDVAGQPGLRNGDLALGYSYSFNQEISANPWVPSNIGTGIGLSFPTGSVNDGTGDGSYVVAPRLGYVARVGHSLALMPSIEFRKSFASEDGARDIKAIAGTMPILYVNPDAFWLNFSPVYFEDLTHQQGAFGWSILIGKLFLKHLAVSLKYARLPTFGEDISGHSETIYQNSWNIGFHIPFSYPDK